MSRIFVISGVVVAAVLAALYFYGLGGPAPVTRTPGDQAEPAVAAPSALEPGPGGTGGLAPAPDPAEPAPQ
jgi:hypothetical protein